MKMECLGFNQLYKFLIKNPEWFSDSCSGFFFLAGLYYFFDLEWLKIPWTPLALVGTAVAENQ
jgi:hypothetical protein